MNLSVALVDRVFLPLGGLPQGDGLPQIRLVQAKPMAGARCPGRFPHQQNQSDRRRLSPGDGQAVRLREMFHADMLSPNRRKNFAIYVLDG